MCNSPSDYWYDYNFCATDDEFWCEDSIACSAVVAREARIVLSFFDEQSFLWRSSATQHVVLWI